MRRGIPVGRGTRTGLLGILLVFVLVLEALLVGCGGSEDEGASNIPPSRSAKEVVGNVVVVRVSGT